LREQNGGGGGGGNRHVHAQRTVRRGAAKLLADGARIAQEAAEPPDIQRDKPGAVRFHARRKIARQLYDVLSQASLSLEP